MLLSSLLRRAVVVSAGLCCIAAAHAAAPQLKTQSPGFYRMMLGDFEITALSDGTVDLKPKELLTNTTQAQVGNLLERSFESDAVPTSVNAYLINTGDKLVLVDTGAATLFGPTLGNLLASLAASGYKPEQADADFWLSAEKLAAAPEAMKGFFQGAMASMNPYVSGAKFKPFQGATNLFAGIRAVATPGHTPGHTVTPSSRRGKN